ncbi:MAG: hypothetical protein KatS3mg005_2264 [Bryobacteraceae bacterium]|nr:MAG: hypothetical protein KatS3mg005_2264 [Bryobacteraceae bacterium]
MRVAKMGPLISGLALLSAGVSVLSLPASGQYSCAHDRTGWQDQAAGALTTDLRPLAHELASRFPENSRELRKRAETMGKSTTVVFETLYETVLRSGKQRTTYSARVEADIYPSHDEARKGLTSRLARYPVQFSHVAAPTYGEVCYERARESYSKVVIFLRRNAVVYVRYDSPRTFSYDPDSLPAVTNVVRHPDPLIGLKCDELATFIDQFLIRAQ